MVVKFLKYFIVSAGLAMVMNGCGEIPVPPLKNDPNSAYLYEKEAYHIAYRNRLPYPMIRRDGNNILIPLYRDGEFYRGFFIDLTKKSYNVGTMFIRPYEFRELPSVSSTYKITYGNRDPYRKWPTYWIVLNHRDIKIFFKWDVTSIIYSKVVMDEGNLEVMILNKNASNSSKQMFSRKLEQMKNTNTPRSEADKAAAQYFNYLMGALSSQISSALSDSSSSTSSVTTNYDGYTDWNGHYTYNMRVNGTYNGQIFYYDKDGSKIIMTAGIKKGRSVNGSYSDGTLSTPQCGRIEVGSIEDAVKKVANCSYEGTY